MIKSWTDMTSEEKQEHTRILTIRWLEQARDDSPLIVLTAAAAIITVILRQAPEKLRPALRKLLEDVFKDEPDLDLDGVLLN